MPKPEAKNQQPAKTRRRLVAEVVTVGTMPKTVVVKVTRPKQLPKYHKIITVSKKFKCHYEKADLRVGHQVLIEECRPLAKQKKWRVLRIIK